MELLAITWLLVDEMPLQEKNGRAAKPCDIAIVSGLQSRSCPDQSRVMEFFLDDGRKALPRRGHVSSHQDQFG